MNDMIIALLASLSHSFGGSLGWAIVVLSLGIRVALLPLTISLARRARRNQEIMQRLQPEIDRLRQRYEKRPERLFEEMRKLYRQHDCSPFDIPMLVGSFIQLPIFGMLYSSIRNSLTTSGTFLWIRSLASPDVFADAGDFIFDGRFGLFDAIGFRADEKHTDRPSSRSDFFYRLETGGWLGTLLGVIQLGGSVSSALASLS